MLESKKDKITKNEYDRIDRELRNAEEKGKELEEISAAQQSISELEDLVHTAKTRGDGGPQAKENEEKLAAAKALEPNLKTNANALESNAQDALARARQGLNEPLKATTPAKEEKEFDESQYDTAQCVKAHDVAEECCAHPDRCFGKPDGQQSDKDGITGALLQIGMGTAMNLPASSISAMCGRMQTASQAMTVVNGHLALQCGRYVSQCKKACLEPAQKILAEYDSTDAKRRASEFNSLGGECKSFDNQSMRLASQAVANQVGAQLAGYCKDANKSPTINTDQFAVENCGTPAAASSAYCQALCNQAGAASNPQCAGYPGLNDGNGGGADTGSGSGNGPNGNFSHLLADEEDPQGLNMNDVTAQSARSTGAMGGGSLSGLGGGGDAGGGGEGAQGPGGAGDGYNTKIDRGLASGNGYSSIGGNFRTGTNSGFSGYGSGSSAITNAGKPFSLKDFLPGSNKPGTKLAMRGIATSVPDVSPSHADIFKKVTDRFYQVCLRDGLYDCASVKKKKTGN